MEYNGFLIDSSSTFYAENVLLFSMKNSYIRISY